MGFSPALLVEGGLDHHIRFIEHMSLTLDTRSENEGLSGLMGTHLSCLDLDSRALQLVWLSSSLILSLIDGT